jgi:hypothetical protein
MIPILEVKGEFVALSIEDPVLAERLGAHLLRAEVRTDPHMLVFAFGLPFVWPVIAGAEHNQ